MEESRCLQVSPHGAGPSRDLLSPALVVLLGAVLAIPLFSRRPWRPARTVAERRG